MSEPEPALLMPLPASEYTRAGVVLGRAFREDPLWLMVFRESELVDLGFRSMVGSGFALPRFAMRLPSSDRSRMMAVLQQLEKRKKLLVPEPHWYLSAIGVDPARQSGGLGSRLVQAGLRRADEANVPVYLETETESNVGFYEHLGFEMIEQITASGLDLPIWLMMRRAA